MNTEPLITIGAVFTSIKVAVTAILTVVALGLEMSPEMMAAVIGAGAAVTIAVGDIAGYVLTHSRVTPIASPVLAIGTAVNERGELPPAEVVER